MPTRRTARGVRRAHTGDPRYWTPERRAAALARSAPRGAVVAPPAFAGGMNAGPVTSLTSLPVSAIGLVHYSQGGQDYVATGSLAIDQQTILTAGHVLWDGLANAPSENISFAFLGDAGTMLAISQVIVPSGWAYFADPAFDVGLACLDAPVPVTQTACLALAASVVDFTVLPASAYGVPSQPAGVFPFDGQTLWQCTSQVIASSAFEPTIQMVSVLAQGADGGPWIGNSGSANAPVFGVFGISATQFQTVWSSPNFLPWLMQIYVDLHQQTAMVTQNNAETLGQGAVSLAFARNTLYAAGAGYVIPYNPTSLQPGRPRRLEWHWLSTPGATLAANGVNVFAATDELVTSVTGSSHWQASLPELENSVATYALAAASYATSGAGWATSDLVMAVGASVFYWGSPQLTGPLASIDLPYYDTPGASAAILPVGPLTIQVDGAAQAGYLALAADKGSVSGVFMALADNAEGPGFSATTTLLWTITLSGLYLPISLTFSGSTIWAACDGEVYLIGVSSSLDENGSSQFSANFINSWTITKVDNISVALASDDDVVCAVSANGIVGFFETGGRGYCFQDYYCGYQGSVASVAALGGGLFAVGIGGAVLLCSAYDTAPETLVAGLGRDAVSLALNPNDLTRIYAAANGVVSMIPLTSWSPIDSASARASEGLAMRRRRRATKCLLRSREWSADLPASPAARAEALAAYWTEARKAEARRASGVAPTAGSSSGPVADTSVLPYAAVGELFATLNGVDWQSSAVVVGSSQIMTAAHVVYDGGLATNLGFVPPGAGAPTIPVHAPLVADEWIDARDPQYDVAVATLASPAPSSALGMQVVVGAMPPAAMMLGYPTNQSGAQWQSTGAVTPSPSGVEAAMSSTMGAGSDGGPWINPNTLDEIVGVNASQIIATWNSPVLGDWVLDLLSISSPTGWGNLSIETQSGPVAVAAVGGYAYAGNGGVLSMAAETNFLQDAIQIAALGGSDQAFSLAGVPPLSPGAIGTIFLGYDGAIASYAVGSFSSPVFAKLGEGGLPVQLLYIPGAAPSETYIGAACGGSLFLMELGLAEALPSLAACDDFGPSGASLATDGACLYAGFAVSGVGQAVWASFDNGQWGAVQTAWFTDTSSGVVHLVSAQDAIYAGDSGAVWQFGASSSWRSIALGDTGVETRLTTDGANIFAGASGVVAMVDPSDFSAPVWTVQSFPAGYPVSVLFSQGVLIAASNGQIKQLDPATGEAVWSGSLASGVTDCQLAMDPADPFAVYVAAAGVLARWPLQQN